MQNIGGENAGDAFYRYKMPKLVAKIEGRGNGIKTNVVNNVDIAKALERPPEYILKFFGCELGAQTNYDKNTGTSIVNGAHDQKKLCELLEAFIKKYVQCYSCGNPETTVKIKKEFIYLKCKACGYVSDVDMRHKVNTFILKNPPENKMSKEEKKLKKAEQERMAAASEAEKREKKEKKDKEKDKDKKKDKKKKKSKGEGEENGDAKSAEGDEGDEDVEEEDEDEVQWMTDTSAAAVAARAAEQLTQATAAMVTQGNIEAEREEARKKAEKEAKKKAAEDAARAAAEAANRRSAAEAGEKLDEAGALAVLEEVQAEGGAAALQKLLPKMSVEGGLAVKVRCLYRALFSKLGPGLKLAGPLKEAVPLLKATASDARGQLAQLLALEWLLAVGAPDRVKEGALALKLLYDEDLEEEEIILEWANRKDAAKVLGVDAEGAKAVRAAVAPVVDWLQEADDSSEEESEEDE